MYMLHRGSVKTELRMRTQDGVMSFQGLTTRKLVNYALLIVDLSDFGTKTFRVTVC
jgi:hypothetical protein